MLEEHLQKQLAALSPSTLAKLVFAVATEMKGYSEQTELQAVLNAIGAEYKNDRWDIPLNTDIEKTLS